MANGRKDGIARAVAVAVAVAKETMLEEGQAPRVPNRHRRDRGPSHGTVVVVAAGILITVREAAVVVLSSSRHRHLRRMWSFMVPHNFL
jgi:hypothetical protein